MSDPINGPVLAASLDELKYLVYEGRKGDTGATGAEGSPGVSPTVTTSAIDGGTRVTITDASGSHSFDVMDGASGAVLLQTSTDPEGVKYYGGGTTIPVSEIKAMIQAGKMPFLWYANGTQSERKWLQYYGSTQNQNTVVFENDYYRITLEDLEGFVGVVRVTISRKPVLPSAGAEGKVPMANSDGEWVAEYPIPKPSASDAGKVLTVAASGGSYGWQTPSGGSGAFEIPVTSSTSGGVTTYAVDSSVSALDIYEHKNNLVLVLNGHLAYPFTGGTDSGPGLIDYCFSIQKAGNGQVETEWLKLTARNGSLFVSPYSMDFAPLPAVAAADNGKFLRVVSGAWAAAAVPSAESVSFGGDS